MPLCFPIGSISVIECAVVLSPLEQKTLEPFSALRAPMHNLNATELALLRAALAGHSTNKRLAIAIGRSHTRTSVVVNGLVRKRHPAQEAGGDDLSHLVLRSSSSLHRASEAAPGRAPRPHGLARRLEADRLRLAPCCRAPASHPFRTRELVLKTGLSSSSIRTTLATAIRYGVVKRRARYSAAHPGAGLCQPVPE